MCIRDRLEEQRPEVARVEELDSEARVELAQPAQLAVLIPDQALLERGELHVEVQLGKVEVGAEALEDRAGAVEEDRERLWLVLPGDGIEVEDPAQLRLAGVSEGRGKPDFEIRVEIHRGQSSRSARRLANGTAAPADDGLSLI